ncbi:unnamed protein product, partial [Polarella glacialis]
EKLAGYKTVEGGAFFGGNEARVRVPVFVPKSGGTPYYYSPLKPRERVYLKNVPFKRIRKLNPKRRDRRMEAFKEAQELSQQNSW